MLRSVGAVLIGFVTIAALSLGTDLVVRAVRPEAFSATARVDDPGLLLFTLVYVGVFAVGGCYLTARLAPAKPMRHALVLGALGLVFNVAGTAAMWHTAPVWYHVVALALVMPFAWAGGWLRVREVERGTERAEAMASLA